MDQQNDSPKTHFGYEQVNVEDKADRVADVFHSVAAKYDVMNDLMSAGIHRLWKRFTLELSAVRAGHKVLDIAGGTGDLSYKFSRLVGPGGQVILADINESMLKVGRDRLLDRGVASNLQVAQADAQCLPFPDNTFDCITIAFGLRNVTDKDKALRSMLRVLKPGGRLLVLEFSKPGSRLLEKAYDAYSFRVLPVIGKLVANDADSYRYLAESIRMHPDQETLKTMMTEAGFNQCEYYNMTGGVVALHRGHQTLMAALHTAALAALESSINGALRYDPGTRGALGRLHGKILEIDSSAPTFRFFIAPDTEGVQLLGHIEGEVTTRLHGPLPALLSLAAGDNTSLAGSDVDMSGSSAFLSDLQRILKRVDIDWEEPISRLVGDVAGHEAGTAIRTSLHWLSGRAGTANRLLGEYLTEELRSLPAPAEVQSFCADVDAARLSADRLAAKIDQLKQLVEQLRAPPPPQSEPHND